MKKIYFQIPKNFDYKFLLSSMTVIILLIVPASIFSVALLNFLLVAFDICLLFFFIKNHKQLEIEKKEKIILSIFLIILILNIFFSENFNLSITRAFNVIKNFFFIFGFIFILQKIKNLNYLFLASVFVSVLFVTLDSYYQFFLGQDIFGYKKISNLNGRLTGPFGDEWVVGSFVSKLCFLSILFVSIYKKKILNIFFLFIFIIITILSNERIAAIMLIFSSFFYLVFYDKKFFKNLINLVLLSTLIILIIFNNKNIKERYINTTFEQLGIYKSWHNPTGKFTGSQYFYHYASAIRIFNENIIFGSGLKTFRYVCSMEKYKPVSYSNNGCSTHPHNFYLEILAETGSIGFVFFIFLIFKLFKQIINVQDRYKKITLISLFLLLFWPFKTTGSIFASWNSFLYVINISYILYLSRYSALKKK